MNHETTDASEIGLGRRRFDVSNRGWRLGLGLIYARFRQWRIEMRAIRHLESLDDHRLDDLGIERSQIRAAVRGMPGRQEISRHPNAVPRESDSRHRLAA